MHLSVLHCYKCDFPVDGGPTVHVSC